MRGLIELQTLHVEHKDVQHEYNELHSLYPRVKSSWSKRGGSRCDGSVLEEVKKSKARAVARINRSGAQAGLRKGASTSS